VREFKSNLLATLWEVNPLADASLDLTPDKIISRIEFALDTTERKKPVKFSETPAQRQARHIAEWNA
jgi:hypothetical protein